MTRFHVFAFLMAGLLPWTFADAAATPADLPSTVSQRAGDPGSAEVLGLCSFSMGPRWNGGWEQRGAVALQVRLRLDSAPDDWLQVSIRVPDGYRSGEWGPGEWIPFYFLAHSATATFDINLQPTAAADSTVSFPILVQAGTKRAWLSAYLNGTPSGYASALVEIGPDGNPRWFPDETAPPGAEQRPTSYWSLTTSVSDAFAFIAHVLQLDLHIPDYFSRWCGVGTRPGSRQAALSEVAFYAGCEVQRLGDREYAIEFPDGYRGAPDTSWFVVHQGEELRVYADGAPAADLIPALLESAGATMATSPDLGSSAVTCDWTGSLRGCLEAICRMALPPLAWAERDGVFSFAARREN